MVVGRSDDDRWSALDETKPTGGGGRGVGSAIQNIVIKGRCVCDGSSARRLDISMPATAQINRWSSMSLSSFSFLICLVSSFQLFLSSFPFHLTVSRCAYAIYYRRIKSNF